MRLIVAFEDTNREQRDMFGADGEENNVKLRQSVLNERCKNENTMVVQDKSAS